MMKVSIARRRLEKMSVSKFTDAELRARNREAISFGESRAEDKGLGKVNNAGKTKLMFPLSREQNSALETIFNNVAHHSRDIPASLRRNSNFFVLTLNPSKDKPTRFISAKEMAEILSVSRSSIYRQVNRGNLQAFRVGRILRFDFSRVLDLLTSNTARVSEGSRSEE